MKTNKGAEIMRKLTIHITHIIHIWPYILECWFSAPYFCHMYLLNQPQTCQDICNIIETANLCCKQELNS